MVICCMFNEFNDFQTVSTYTNNETKFELELKLAEFNLESALEQTLMGPRTLMLHFCFQGHLPCSSKKEFEGILP